MADPQILTQLRAKQAEIERRIEALEVQAADARSALLHLAAVIRIFDPKASDDTPAAGYMNVTKALPISQMLKRCQDALRGSAEPLCTRALARHIIVTSGWDVEDRRLRLSVAHRVGGLMARREKRGQVVSVGERDGVTLWRIP